MSEYVLPPPVQPSLRIAGSSARFAVRRIYCVGRNYAEHAREMGHDAEKEAPFFFSKPADALWQPGAETLRFPRATADLHHEVEWVLALGARLQDASPAEAAASVWGHAVGIDLTKRDLQAIAKKAGRPWDLAKGFDESALVGLLQPLNGALPSSGRIQLAVNGQLRQQGDLGDLIWNAPALLAELSRFVTLMPGDLVYTGTPAGVAALRPGDAIDARIEGLPALQLELGDV
jgi:fumarylpyruvate hydrolase